MKYGVKQEKRHLLRSLYDWLFPLPAVCPLCMKPQKTLQICDTCQSTALRQRSTYGQCERCGSFGVYSATCRNCREWPAYYIGNLTVWPYQDTYKQVIKEYKYHHMPWLADSLAQVMAPYLPRGYDLLVPVPLHPNRLQERGYNQSELLVQSLSRISGIPWQNSLLRVRDTPHQTGLGRVARMENLHDAFLCSKYAEVRNKKIILVDDVITTGSTLYACAKELHRHGAKEIVSCTLAGGQARF